MRALITGAVGQDGWYLRRLLLDRSYEVHAHARSSRDRDRAPPLAPARQGSLRWHFGDIGDPDHLAELLRAVKPDEIYHLAAFSSPRQAMDLPIESSALNAFAPMHGLRHCPAVPAGVPDLPVVLLGDIRRQRRLPGREHGAPAA